ncbi:MAG: CopD family protein [Phototrophicaceae bacterium]
MKRLSLLCLLLILSLQVVPASAHGYILRSIPENRATLERSPTRLQYWFSESLEPQFSEFILRDQQSNIIATGNVDENSDSLMSLRLDDPLPDGAYIVELRPAFASDGHVIVESYVFFVGNTVSGVEGTAASDLPVPLEVVWRILVQSSLILLFGTYLLYSIVLLPAWGSRQHAAGLLPPRVMVRLNQIAIFAFVLTFTANLLALLQQTMVFFDVSPIQVISQNLWQVVRVGSQFGSTWNIRMTFLVFAALSHGASMYFHKRQPGNVRALWIANTWLLALCIGTLSVNSHAAGALFWPWVGIAVDWFHAMGVALWVGGICALILVLPVALRPYEGDTRRQALLIVMNRFSFLITGAVVLVITTGIYSALNWFYTPTDVLTTYGAALGIKLLMVGLLLFVGALHHFALRPQQWQQLQVRLQKLLPVSVAVPLSRSVQKASDFILTLRLEVVIALGTLITVGLLSSTPIPQPTFLDEEVETPQATQYIDNFEITTSIIPGGPGVNTYDTVIQYNGEPLAANADVYMRFVNPQRDQRSAWLSTEPVEDGLFVATGAEIDEVGQWWTLITIQLSDDEFVTFSAFDWEISDEASVTQTRPATIFNILAFLGLLAGIGFALSPAARVLNKHLDWSPANVTILIMSVLFTIIALGGSAYVLEQNSRQIELQRNPPPEIINPTLPNQVSVQRGQALFEEFCSHWITDEQFSSFSGQLRLLRDEEIYQVTIEGWRDLLGCTTNLSPDDRWDLVNYIRTYEIRRIDDE